MEVKKKTENGDEDSINQREISLLPTFILLVQELNRWWKQILRWYSLEETVLWILGHVPIQVLLYLKLVNEWIGVTRDFCIWKEKSVKQEFMFYHLQNDRASWVPSKTWWKETTQRHITEKFRTFGTRTLVLVLQVFGDRKLKSQRRKGH